MFSFQIKTKHTIKERRQLFLLRLRAVGVFFLAFVLAWGAWTRTNVTIRLTYTLLVFTIIFFGSIWVETIYRRLRQYPTNHNKFVGWFFAACVTAWWVGVEMSRYAAAMRNGTVSFTFIDYTSWATYVSLFLILVIGYAVLKLVRKNQPLSEKKEYHILVGALALFVFLGALSSFITHNS